MAEPLAVLGGVSSILQIISSVTKLAKSLNEVRESYDNVALNTTLVASQLSTIRAALEAIHTWRASDTFETEASKQLDKDLGLSLGCCAILISVIDGKLADSGYKPGIGMKQKIKYMWLEDTLKEYVSNLEGQVRALQLLLTIFQCRTATEQKQELARAESRTIIEQVRAETMSLSVGETEMDDAISILSHDPSVHLDIDSILMKSPAYVRVYGKHESPRRKKASKPPPPPPRRQKSTPKLAPPYPEAKAESVLSSPGVKPLPQPPSESPNQSSPPLEITPQTPPVPPRPKARNQPRQAHLRTNSQKQQPSQGRINVWDFLGPGQKEEVLDGSTMVMADSAQVFELSAAPETIYFPEKSGPGPKTMVDASTTPDVMYQADEKQPELGRPRTPKPTGTPVVVEEIDNASREDLSLATSGKESDMNSRRPSSEANTRELNDGLVTHHNASQSIHVHGDLIEGRTLALRQSENGEGELEMSIGSKGRAVGSQPPNSCIDKSRESYSFINGQGGTEPESFTTLQENERWSSKQPKSLEGFRNQLDLAFEENDSSRTGTKGLRLSLGSRGSRDARPSREELLAPTQREDGADGDAETKTDAGNEAMNSDAIGNVSTAMKVSPRTLSIHSSVDLYEVSVRDKPLEEDSRPSSQSSARHETVETASMAPADEKLDAEMDGLSIPNQQLAAKHIVTPVYNDATSSIAKSSQRASTESENAGNAMEASIEEHRPIEISSHGLGVGPQIVMTPSQDDVDGTATNSSSPSPKAIETPVSPSRPPPLPPTLTTSTPSIPLSSSPFFDPGTRNSGVETSTASSGRDSSVFEASLTISSSEQSGNSTVQTMQRSTSNTTATSIGIDGAINAREQAQADLRRLQSELTTAKARNDSQAFQDSLQKSIEVIRRTYLPNSTPVESKKTQNLRDRASFSRRFSTFMGSSNGSALCDAAAEGDLVRVRALLDAKVNVDARGKVFMTPLMLAATNGHIECLNILKQQGADEFAVDSKGRSVLHLAIASNRLPVIKWLLNAYPPPRPQQLKHRPSILSKATDSLIIRSPKNLREVSDAEGSKPLHIAVKADGGGVVEALLAAGVHIESKNNWSRTPLHQAIIAKRRDSVEILLRHKSSVKALDARSMSPLHWAAKTGQADMIEMLLEKGADRYEFDSDGNQPIHQAAWVGKILCIEALLIERKDLEAPTKAGETMLHIACLSKNSELTTYLLKNSVEVNPWAAPQPTLRDSLSKFKVPLTSLTPLHYACCKGDLERAILLLEHEAWVNAATPEGVTALMMAAESEDTNTVNLLLSRGAKVNASMPGTLLTALHIASRRGDLETVQQLCRAGANRQARTNAGSGNYGRTPAEEAMAKCADKVKKTAVEGYFRTIRQNQLRNAHVPPATERQSYERMGRGYRTAPSLDVRPTPPINYAPWGQHNVVPLQQTQYGFQQQLPATYPSFALPAQQQMPEQWYDPDPLRFVESPPPYQAGSTVPARLAAQAPVYRPGDGIGP